MIVPPPLRGLADRLSALRRYFDPAVRFRHRELARDFRAVTDRWRRLTAGLAPSGMKGEVWILSTMSGPWGYKLEAIIALALRASGYTVRVVYFEYDPWRRRYLSLAGVRLWEDFRAYLRHDAVPSAGAEAFRANPTTSTLMSQQYRDVDIGRIALSNHLYRHKFERLDLKTRETRLEIIDGLRAVQRHVRAAERLLEKKRPVFAVVIEKGVSPAAELFGACVAADIPVVQVTNSQHADGFMLKRYGFENRHRHPFSLDDATWERVKAMAWDADREKEILSEFERDYREGRWFNRKFLHEGKTIKSADDARRQLGLDPAKRTVVVFSHVLWDATFFYGKGLFEDYETWLVETVKAAVKNPRVNWVIKLHPDLVWKLKYEKATGPLRDLLVIESASGGLPGHVKLVMPDTDIDTYSFFGLTDVCVTVRGTIGIEMACRGVPVVTGGTGRYSGLGFTVDSETSEQYLERLANIQTLPEMSAAETELARRYAYTVFRLRPWQMTSFDVVKRPLQETGHPLDSDIRPAAGLETTGDLVDAPDIKALRRWLDGSDVDHLNTDLDPQESKQ